MVAGRKSLRFISTAGKLYPYVMNISFPRALITAGIAALVFWALVFRPLPAHLGTGIPYTAHHHGPQVTQSLVPGDHLQLLYHFWLTRDMLAGGTPLFHNIYEFNTGDDSARRVIDPGYIPFSLVYAAVSPFAGHAAGWNIAQLTAIFTAFLFILLLARRYSGGRAIAVSATALAMCLPYQWITLATGSPTGFGMALVPAIALGLDIAIRDLRARGGFLAGAALILSYTTDLHCFFFGALFIPAWCLVARSARKPAHPASKPRFLPARREIPSLLRALAPAVLAALAAVFIAGRLQKQYATTDVAAGRSLREVLANSPSPAAMWGRVARGADLHFRIGPVLLGAILLGALTLLALALRGATKPGAPNPDTPPDPGPEAAAGARPRITAFLILAGIAAILLLGMGLAAPPRGLPIRLARELIPPYGMIRQPVKILCLLPAFLAPFLALCASLAARRFNARKPRFAKHLPAAALLLAAALALADLATALRMGIATLPPADEAYRAVERDAARRGANPHILVLPIWPGDSAWSSLYEYRAMLGRIRMVNGYSPAVSEHYLRDIFPRFESVTQGRLTDEQAAALREMGVTALVLQEDFPEQVSPFPVVATLERLRANPRLKLLAHGAGAHAFALLDTAETDPPPEETDAAEMLVPRDEPANALLPPARRWHFPADLDAGPTNHIVVTTRSPIADRPDLRWMLRIEGDGIIEAERGFVGAEGESDPPYSADEIHMEGAFFLAKPAERQPAERRFAKSTATLRDRETGPDGGIMRWVELAAGEAPDGWACPRLSLSMVEGEARVTDILLGAGVSLLKRDNLRLAAADLFRGGRLEFDGESILGVCFSPSRDAPGEVLYGPFLPLSAGSWRLETEGLFDPLDPAPATLRIFLGDSEVAAATVGAGAAPAEFVSAGLHPLTLRLHYAGRTELRVDAFVLRRVRRE